MRRLFCIILSLVLLTAVILPLRAAAAPQTLSDRIAKFIYDNGLDDSNFALSYFNCATEETYAYNADACFPAGNLWKLSLHMYYYEQEMLGAFVNPEKPSEVYTIAGMDLEECRYRSIILGDEETSIKMRDEVGSYDQYKLAVNEAFGHIPEDKIPEEFYHENVYSTRFWINSLVEIFHHGENFQNMMRNFAMVQTADGLAGYDKTYPMTHIRGEENGFVSDAGQIHGAQSYLLACSVSKEAGGDEILAKINTLICSYVEEVAGQNRPSGSDDFYRGEGTMTVVSGGKTNQNDALLWVGIAVGGFIVLAAAIGIPTILVLRHKRDNQRYD